MNHSRKKEELRKYIEDHKEEIQKLSVETRWFLGILLEQYTIVDERVMEVKDMCEAWDGAVKLQAQIEGRVIAQELAPKMAEEMAAKIAKDMAADMENRIRNRRKELGLSQEELAKKCGVSRQTVNAIENNKYDPTLSLAFNMARELQLTVDELFIPS